MGWDREQTSCIDMSAPLEQNFSGGNGGSCAWQHVRLRRGTCGLVAGLLLAGVAGVARRAYDQGVCCLLRPSHRLMMPETAHIHTWLVAGVSLWWVD